VHLQNSTGDSLTLHLDGYQFADAADLRKRHSWHLPRGTARCQYGEWSFRWQALTCDESPLISGWLRRVADWLDTAPGQDRMDPREQYKDGPPDLGFMEPNIRFRVEGELDRTAVVRIDLDLEFRPPWHLPPGRYVGDEYSLRLRLTAGHLRAAADEWDQEVAAFPDLNPSA
jgi:hypothetical protein